jgi:thymidine phosphorylase
LFYTNHCIINDCAIPLAGSFLMACHLRGLNEGEVENLMRAMMFSGRLMKWPSEWGQKIVSLQSTGSTGNKAKLILAPAMAACGVKVLYTALLTITYY